MEGATEASREYAAWSGRGMGYRDVGLAAARAPTALVGVVGDYDAGKTTLLTSLYLHVQRGISVPGRKFAGSLTLGGWEERAHFLRWPSARNTENGMFPLHTPAGLSREASLLHLSVTGAHGRQEVFVTDAPGEWFTRWATSADSAAAEGARWIASRAAGFILVLDTAALAGKSDEVDLGQGREQSLALIARLGAHLCGRPLALVWAKADELDGVDERVRGAVERAVSHHVESPHRAFATSVVDTAGRESPMPISAPPDILGWVLDEAAVPTSVESPSSVHASMHSELDSDGSAFDGSAFDRSTFDPFFFVT